MDEIVLSLTPLFYALVNLSVIRMPGLRNHRSISVFGGFFSTAPTLQSTDLLVPLLPTSQLTISKPVTTTVPATITCQKTTRSVANSNRLSNTVAN